MSAIVLNRRVEGDQRRVVRCVECKLVQFMSESARCVACQRLYEEEDDLVTTPKLKSNFIPVVGIDFAFAVKLLRQANNLSQNDLARRLACPRTYISKLETRNCIPLIINIPKIALALEIPVWLFIMIATLPPPQVVTPKVTQ